MPEDFIFHVLVRVKGHDRLRVYEETKSLFKADELASALINLSLYDRVEIHKLERYVIKSFV